MSLPPTSYMMSSYFAPGKQNVSQGQNGLFSGQIDGDHRRTTPHIGPESSCSFPEASGTHTSSKEGVLEQFSLPVSGRPVNPLVTLETNSQGTLYIPPSGEIGHQPSIEQRGFFTMTQKEALSSSGSSSYYWFSEHKSTFEDFAKSTTNTSVCGSPAVDQRLYSEPRYLNCNPQLAESIQKNFELDKADLDELLNYPEEQTTAENLPYLLKEIRTKKAIRAGSAVQSYSSSMSRPTACTSGEDLGVGSGPQGILQDKRSSTLQPIIVTKNEQPAPCSADVDMRIGRNVSWGNTLVTDRFQSSNWTKEVQMGCLVGPPPRVDQTRQLQTQSNQTRRSGTTQSISFRQTGISQGQRPEINSQEVKVSNCVYAEEYIAGVQDSSVKNICNTAQAGGKTLLMDSSQSKEAPHPGLAVLKGSSLVSPDDQVVTFTGLNSLRIVLDPSSSNPAEKLETQQNQNSRSVPPLPLQQKAVDATSTGESNTQGQGSSTADPMKNPLKKTNIWELLEVLQAFQPAVSSAAKSKIQNVSDAVLPSAVISNDPFASVSQSKPISTKNTVHVPSSEQHSQAEPESCKDLPSLSMMHDYAAVMPRTFSHTCSLCKKECAQKKDWITHEKSTLHKENCKRLRTQYPHWDGVVPSLQSDPSTCAKTLSPTSLHHHQKNKCDSRSHSRSRSSSCFSSGDARRKSRGPSRGYSSGHRSSSKSRRDRSRSSSRSHSQRCSSRDGKHKSNSSVHSYTSSCSRSRRRGTGSSDSSCSRSCSPRNHGSRYRRIGSNGSSRQRRLQRGNSRSRSRSCSPHYNHSAPSRYRSRSRSYEKQSSPKRMSKKSISPRRKNERRLSRGRSPARRLPPRSDQKQMRFSPGNTGEKSRGRSRGYGPSHRSSSKNRRDRSSSSSRSHSHRLSSRDGKNKLKSSVHLYTTRRSRSRRRGTGSSNSSHSRSYSPKNHTSRYRRDRYNGNCLQRRLQRSNSRSRSRSCSPRYNRSAPSCYRPHSRSYEKQSSPYRTSMKSFSPGRMNERRLSQGRSPMRRLSPRSDQKHNSKRLLRPQDNGKQWSLKRSLERQSSPTKTDNKSLSPIRRTIRQSPPRNIDDRRCSPTSGWERDVSSGTRDRRRSPERSRDQQPSPRKNDKRWSPTRRLLRQVSPRRTNNRRWSPTSASERRVSPRRTDERRRSQERSPDQQSSPRKKDDRKWSPRRGWLRQVSPRRTSDKQWSPTNGSKRRMSPRRTDDRQWSPERSRVQQSLPRKNDRRWSQTRRFEQSPPENADVKQWSPPKTHERLSPPRYNDKQCSHPRRTDDRRYSLEGSSKYQQRTDDKTRPLTRSLVRPWSPRTDMEQSLTMESHRQQSFPRRDEKQVLPKNGSEVMSSMRQNRKRHASLEEEVSSQKKKSCSIQMLTKQLLENSALQSVSKQSNIEDVVNVVVPVLLAELAKNPELSSPQLVLPSQAINRMVLKPSSSGLKSSSSSNKGAKMQPKLKIKSTYKKTKDGASKRVLSVTAKRLKKPKPKAGVTDDLAPCDNLDLLPIKKLLSLHQKLVRKAKLLSSSRKHISSSKARPLKKRALESVLLNAEPLKLLGSKRSLDTRPQSGLSKQRTGPVVSRKDQDIGAKVTEKTRVKKATRITVAESNKRKKIVSKVKSAATKKSTNKPMDKTAKCLREAKLIKVEDCSGDKGPTQNSSLPELKESKPLGGNVMNTSDPPQALRRIIKTEDAIKSPGEIPNSGGTTKNPKFRDSEVPVKVEGSIKAGAMLEATAAEAGTGKEMVTKAKVNGSKTSADKWQNKNAKCSPDGEVVKLLETTNNHPSVSVIASTSLRTETQPTVKPPESLVNQPKVVPNPNTSDQQLLAQPQSSDRPLDALQKTGLEEKKTNQKDAAASETQKNRPQAPAAAVPAPSTAADACSSTASSDVETAAAPNATDASPTVGERIASYLDPTNFNCVPAEEILSSKPFALDSTLLLITNLPACEAGCSYTEEEVVNLLSKFEFQYAHDNIYVIPQGGWAFVLMPNQRSLSSLAQASAQGHLTFKQHKLNLHVVKKDMSMTPLGFYKSLMKQTPLTGTDDDGSSIIYIQNISQSDAATLRKALTKIGCVRNVLPLLNKVFVEFETDHDADRLGVWHSLMREGFVYTVTRLRVPRSTKTSQQPQQPQRALPDRKEILSAAGAPDAKYGVPEGTTAPCWVTTKTAPYVFPTACPWFNVPKFLTVQREEHILTTPHLGSEFSTVMLTGLPEATYKHEDVARLVCRYFPKQDLQSLYYNVMVLPLQRRAFVFFCDWEACCSFVSDCVKKPISVMNCTLGVHLVLEDMHPGASEETMYRALMKWSNGYVPELFLLGKRLLCVEMFGTNVELIKNVMKKVATISSFVTFLPLANRIWVEMVSHSSATKVLQEMSSRRDSSTYVWSKVGRIECANDVHQRLKEAGQITIHLGAKTPGVGAEPPSLKTEAHVPLSQARVDAADASSAAPAAVTESTVAESESKLGDGVAESANEVQDPKVKTASITEESQPCRTTSTVAGNPVSCATDQEKKTQKDPVPNSVSSVSAAPIEALPSAKVQATTKEVVRKQPALSDNCLTPGEQMETLLFIYKIRCHGHGFIMSTNSLESRLLLIYNLPKYQDVSYTEDDISNLLQKFGYQHEDKNIYVIPQACMAFAVMPSYQEAREVFIAAKQNLTLNGSRLFVRIVKSRGVMTPLKFYKCLMETVDFEVTDDGACVVYIHNISPSEARDLRETLNKVESVKNYLPLLNKVFIEFESALDADRIGVWYSLLKRCPPHYIWRTNLPITSDTALPPRLAAKALPDAKDIVAGPVVPVKQLGVPQGSKAPFFISLPNEPFLFPTVSPWFIVPRFSTVLTEEDLVESASVASKFSTVMLTGLPEGNYKHEEVAQLVWKYFPKQNLWVSFYNIVVLPLQKRAFVYFNDWRSCREFAEDFLKNQVSLKGHVLNVHLILEEMHPKFREELMYQTLMKWSNAHVPELESLQDRLLCVELLETSLPLIKAILTSVTSVSPIVSFLSLANRVCIEMADPRGVTLVVARHAQKPEDWNHFGRVETVKSLKQRLKDSCKTKIDLEMHTKDINAKTAVKSEPPPQVGTVNVEVTEVKGESSAERLTPATTVKTGKSPETGRTCAAASSAEASSLTPAEKVFWHLKQFNPRHKDNLLLNKILSSYILNVNITLGVTNLPRFGNGCYTQTDIINLLQNLGLKCQDHQFFFVPESRRAFLIQANAREVQKFFKTRNWRNVFFQGSQLFFYVFQNVCPLTSFGFYRFLMSFSDFLLTCKHFDETNVVYLRNVSEHKVQELKEAISKNDSVINYLPLHDKVFIHCKTPLDAERVKAWYSFWKHRLSHNIQQMAMSDTFNTSKRPGLAAPALPLGQKVADGPNVPITTDANPEGSRATFWITMTRSPYMFHIAAPWFNIPAYQTISHITHLEPHLKFPTIMLTGLPNPTYYTHEDVALLVWKYFPEQTLHTLYNNVVVLPLQRRAFVFFSSSHACLRFLQDQKKIQIRLKDSLLKIHLVLEDIHLGSSEVSMFRTLMEWSNIHVPERDSLEERLLCVEVSGTNDKNVMMVMKEVAMIATFASFLPLANRIYIEMVDPSGASKVMENLSVSRLADQRDAWKRVGRVESLVSRKERLKDARKIAVNLERGTMSVYREATQLKGPLCSRKEEELATLKALPDKSLLPSHKGTEYPPIDLNSLNKLKAIILQLKNERRSSTLNNEISSESGSSSESCSSSNQTTEETKSSHLSSAITDIPTKDLKSFGSPCGSTNTSLSPSSTSLSGKKQRASSESTNSTADTSKISPSSSPSKCVEFSASSNERSQSKKSETLLRAPQTASTGGNSCSSAEPKPTTAAVAKADLRVSSESCTTETQSDSRTETSVVSPPAQGQNLEFTKQIQNEESFKDETLKQAAVSKEKRDNNVKSPVEEVHHSLAEQKGKQNCSPETPGSEKGQILCQADLQVSDNVVDRKKEFNKMDVEAILDAEENRTEERTLLVNREKRLVIDEGSAVKPDCRPEATESLDKHPETQSANRAETETAERTEEMICKDSVPDESFTQRSVRRTSRQDETNQDKVATDEPTITTRATRETIKITQEDSLDGSEDKNQRETRSPPSRDSQKHNKEESQETEETSVKDVKPTTCEQKPSQEISDNVNFRETEEEEQDAATTRRRTGPTPERKSTRGMRSESPCERTLERCSEKEKEEETCRDTVKGRRTRSSSAAVKTPVETNQSQEKEGKPTEIGEINSVAIEGKSAKTAPVVDSPALGEKLDVSKAETSDSRPEEGLQASHGANGVQRCSQSETDAAAEGNETVTDDRPASGQEENNLTKDEGLVVKPSQTTGASKPENGENSPKNQEGSAQKNETQTKDSSTEMETEGAEEMVYRASVRDESGTKRSFRQTTRLAKQDKTKKDKAAVNAPTVATTSATSRKRKITEKESLVERKEEETPTRRRRAAAIDSPQSKEKTQKAAEVTAPKDVTPLGCEQNPSPEISEDLSFRRSEEEEQEAATTRRGRPKKTTGPAPGRRTRSSSAAVKTPVETNQSQEKEGKPTEIAEINSVAIEGKSAKTAPVVDSPALGEKLDVSKAETSDSRPEEGLQASHGANEVQRCSQSETDAAAEGNETVTDDRPASVQEENNLTKDEGLVVKPSQRTAASKPENGENSPKNQEGSAQKNETQTKDSSTEMETEGAEEMVYRASVRDESGTKRSFRQTTRLAKQDKTKKDKAAVNAPTVATTSATSRKRKITEKESLVERKEEETPTRRRRAAAIDSPQSKEKTQKAAEETAPKDVTPLGCEQNPSPEISEDLSFRRSEEEEQEAATTRRGRPKKTTGPAPGRRTRSSSAAVKTPVETNQSQEKEGKPTEIAEINSVAIEGKSAKTAPVVDSPALGEKLDVSKAETSDSRPEEGLQASHGANEVQRCSQSETDAAAEGNETVTDDRPASVQEENNLTKDEGLVVKPSQRTGASKPENGENSPKNQEGSAQKNETQTKDSSTEMETEGAEEMVYRASVRDESGTKRSFRQTTRLAKQDKTKKDKAAVNAPTVATTSATSRKRKITEKESLVERKEEETPTRRRRAAAIDSPQSKEKTQKAAEETAPKDVTPLGCEQNPSPEISEDLSFRRSEEEEQEAATTRRGRPKKTTGPAPGCRTRSSSAAVKTPVETNQSQEKEQNPTEIAEVKSVATATQRRGQPKKTTRPAPVRKSTRVRMSYPDGEMLERLRNKRKMKFPGPEAKRSRSRFGRPDVRRPPFKP